MSALLAAGLQSTCQWDSGRAYGESKQAGKRLGEKAPQRQSLLLWILPEMKGSITNRVSEQKEKNREGKGEKRGREKTARMADIKSGL